MEHPRCSVCKKPLRFNEDGFCRICSECVSKRSAAERKAGFDWCPHCNHKVPIKPDDASKERDVCKCGHHLIAHDCPCEICGGDGHCQAVGCDCKKFDPVELGSQPEPGHHKDEV